MATTDWFNAAFGIVFGAGWALACLIGAFVGTVVAGVILWTVIEWAEMRWRKRHRR